MKVSNLCFAVPCIIGAVIAAASQPSTGCPGYTASNYKTTADGFSADLTLAGNACNFYGNDIANLQLTVQVVQGNTIRVLIDDKDQKQFQIPQEVVNVNRNPKNNMLADLKFDYENSESAGFGFKISRGDEVIFNTIGYPIVFEEQYLEITSSLPANANIYGMGETQDYFRRNSANSTKTIWARDAGDPFQENIYGSHTIYMESRNGKFHGAHLHNSHGMDIVLINSTIQYRILGGVFDFNFFGGPTAYDVINAYTELVGRPNQVPYWTLGFHNCRWGYQTIDEVDQVIANYSASNIPLETMWIDIDYMDRFRDFTFDPVNFPLSRIQKTLDNLHKNTQKMVMMIDPAIQRNSSYPSFARGVKDDVFLKNLNGSLYEGEVWPGYTAFPDWFAPNAQSWWSNELDLFFKDINLDGVWVDMNEAASFCTGSCGSGIPEDVVPQWYWTLPEQPPHRFINTSNTYLVPKYRINDPQPELSDKGLETISLHANGVIDYHVHNLYGHMMAQKTRVFLDKLRPNVRPFLLTRSTFAGTGAYANHWNGDNNADWFSLHVSIPAMLDFGIFGIPFVGSDICGFNSNTTEQLCTRWAEVGAFYPFSRDHNAKGNRPQELYRWPTVAEASRRALKVRYQLLPYYYTYLSKSATSGHPVARPLLFEFPNDTNTLAIDTQFLVGEGIVISPVVLENATSVEAYFPKGNWYDWYTHEAIQSKGQNVTLDAPLEHVNVHIRGGQIVSTQEAHMTVDESRASNFTLIIALDENNKASGDLYLDDGVTYNSTHSIIRFTSDGKSLTSSGVYSYEECSVINTVVVLSVDLATGCTVKKTVDDVNLSLNCGWTVSLT